MVLFDLLAETYWGGFISGDKGHDALGRELQVRVGRTARGAERSSGLPRWRAATTRSPELNATSPDALIPMVPSADDILVLVAGGEGKHSAALPSFGATVSVTRRIGEA